MRHQCRVPLLGRPADQRKALLRGLTTQLIREGRVTTTKARAKALRDEAERMITLAKNGSLASRRRVLGYVYDKQLVHALFDKAPPASPARCPVVVTMLKWPLSSWSDSFNQHSFIRVACGAKSLV